MATPSPVVRLLCDLIAIDSVNPALRPGRGEAEVAAYIQRFAAERGLEVTTQEVLPGRTNVIVTLPVPGAASTLLFEAHMDTVPHEFMPEGLAPRLRDGRVYGRGACDTKGGLAAMLAALDRLRARPQDLRVNLTLAATVDEEHRYRGVLALRDLGRPFAAAVVAEPTGLEVVTAHKGVARFRVTTAGRAAHTARPDEGENAIEQMAEVVLGLRDDLGPRLRQRHHPLCGRPALTVSMIAAGVAINIVPPACTIDVDRRLLPGEDPEVALAEIADWLADLGRRRPGVKATVSERLTLDPGLDTPPDSPIVQAALRAARSLGRAAEPRGVPYGSDASKLARQGVPSIVLGPGDIAVAHSADEWVPAAEVEQAAELYTRIALGFGGPA